MFIVLVMVMIVMTMNVTDGYNNDKDVENDDCRNFLIFK